MTNITVTHKHKNKNNLTFGNVQIGEYFIDGSGDLCLKIDAKDIVYWSSELKNHGAVRCPFNEKSYADAGFDCSVKYIITDMEVIIKEIKKIN